MRYTSEAKRYAPMLRRTEVLQRLLVRHHDGWGRSSTVLKYPLLVAALCQRGLRGEMVKLPVSVCAAAQEEERVLLHGTEGMAHARLKLAALKWMHREGAIDAKPEVRFEGWIADAYSEDFTWVVECGNTDASRLMDALRWRRVPRFTVIPFQRTHWPGERIRSLIGIDFYWPPSLQRWVEDREIESLRRAADVLNLD